MASLGQESMFKVDVANPREYMAFDSARKSDPRKLDALIRGTTPKLTPHFHAGTPAGEAGMQMKAGLWEV